MKVLVAAMLAAASIGVALPAQAGQELASDVQAGLSAAAAARLAVSEQYMQNGTWPESNEAAGFTVPDGATADIAIGKAGVVTVTYRSPAALAGSSIVLTPSSTEPGAINWKCSAKGVPNAALPPHCK